MGLTLAPLAVKSTFPPKMAAPKVNPMGGPSKVLARIHFIVKKINGGGVVSQLQSPPWDIQGMINGSCVQRRGGGRAWQSFSVPFSAKKHNCSTVNILATISNFPN